jgi:hypothetical protein
VLFSRTTENRKTWDLLVVPIAGGEPHRLSSVLPADLEPQTPHVMRLGARILERARRLACGRCPDARVDRGGTSRRGVARLVRCAMVSNGGPRGSWRGVSPLVLGAKEQITRASCHGEAPPPHRTGKRAAGPRACAASGDAPPRATRSSRRLLPDQSGPWDFASASPRVTYCAPRPVGAGRQATTKNARSEGSAAVCSRKLDDGITQSSLFACLRPPSNPDRRVRGTVASRSAFFRAAESGRGGAIGDTLLLPDDNAAAPSSVLLRQMR